MSYATAGPGTIASALKEATDRLRKAGSSSPRLDAELLLAAVLCVERSRLYAEPDRLLTHNEVQAFQRLLERRAAHEPVAYILGKAYFRRLQLEVTRDVLIPRPETEELVEVALALLRRRPAWGATGAEKEKKSAPLIADVGTGSGAIALSLALESNLRVLATDIDGGALKVAARNATRMGAGDLVEFLQTDLLAGVPACSLHLVVSNPPYVCRGELSTLMPDVRLYEPVSALDGGEDGLVVIRRLVPEAARTLRPGGSMLLEIGHGQAGAVLDLAYACGFAYACVHKDLSGKERIVEAIRPGTCRMPLTDLDADTIGQLAEALASGAVIGVPTDTVYGLAARWDSPEGVARIFAAKGRPPNLPVAVLFASTEAIKRSLPDLHHSVWAVLEALLPGPYTFVVETRVSCPENVGTPDSLGVRVPDHPELLSFLCALGVPLAATSANLSGQPDTRDIDQVDPRLLAHCSLALEEAAASSQGGERRVRAESSGGVPSAVPGQPSTVVDLRPLAYGGSPVILREGAVPAIVLWETFRRLSLL